MTSHSRRARLIRRTSALTIALGAVALATAAAASAHVTVSGPGAASGGSDQVITFRVPTESATASTVGLQVKLPTDTPIASVLVQPHTGWTDKVTTVKLAKPIVTDDGDITEAVSTITWTADSKANGIKPGQFDEFVIIAGQLPDASSLTFPAIQTYSDGSTVSWTQVAAPGSTDEPDHPAPTLSLTAGTAATASKSKSAGSSTTAKVGVVLGAAGIVLSLRRRPE
jgi:uncharacterized protein